MPGWGGCEPSPHPCTAAPASGPSGSPLSSAAPPGLTHPRNTMIKSSTFQPLRR